MKQINLSDLAQCLELLQDIFGNKEVAIEWLKFPHPFLGKSPLLVLSEGNVKLVLKILTDMQSQQFS